MTRMRHERLRRGWSLQKLGERAGVQATDVSKIERQLMVPYAGQRKRLSRVIGCAPEELLDEVDDHNATAAENASCVKSG